MKFDILSIIRKTLVKNISPSIKIIQPVNSTSHLFIHDEFIRLILTITDPDNYSHNLMGKEFLNINLIIVKIKKKSNFTLTK